MLPDDVLLEIFDICQRNHDRDLHIPSDGVWKWHILVHVCRRWRHITFASPLRLNLQILCTFGTPVRKSIDIWPTFPIVIAYYTSLFPRTLAPIDEDNVIAALQDPSRVCEVRLGVTGPQLRKIVTVMQETFPAVTQLILWSRNGDVPVLPGEFLGRSAPCLEDFRLDGIPFPALPVLLPSASDLITLILTNIPQTGYISPEAMVAGLATSNRLRELQIGFRWPNSRPDQIRLPVTTRTVLPALTSFRFRGACEYLEDFAARIDAPQLRIIAIWYLNQLIDFDVPQISRIIDHSDALDLRRPKNCHIQFNREHVSIRASSGHHKSDFSRLPLSIYVCILCEGIDWQVSHLTQALSQTSVVTSSMVHLIIHSDIDGRKPTPEDMDDVEWLRLFDLFSSIRTLSVPKDFAEHVSRLLEVVADGMMATEVLPALDMLYLGGQSVSSVDKFIAARRDSGRPVTLTNSEWEIIESTTIPI